jgi:hypothetical protein
VCVSQNALTQVDLSGSVSENTADLAVESAPDAVPSGTSGPSEETTDGEGESESDSESIEEMLLEFLFINCFFGSQSLQFCLPLLPFPLGELTRVCRHRFQSLWGSFLEWLAEVLREIRSRRVSGNILRHGYPTHLEDCQLVG